MAAALLGVALGLMGAVPAQAAPAGWGQFTFTGASRAWTGTLTQQASGFPVAQLTSTSVGGSSVGIQSGTSTYLSPLTAVGARYGSSQGQGYLNLRPNSQNGPPPSVTTYTFDRPTPTSGWTFVLGDIDADQVTITGTDATGRPVSPAAFGFRDVFNYCVPGVCTPNADVPSWDPATGVLKGNTQALDTNGAAAWFEPNVALSSLTFTYAQRAGFPVYQTWFSSLEHDLTGTITAPAGRQDGITVVLLDPAGNEVGRSTTDDDGNYGFPGFATYDGYRVQVIRPSGLTSDDPLTQSVDLSKSNQQANFTLRAIVPVPAGGTVTDPDGNPVGGVTLTLTDPNGGPDRTTVSESDGTYVFDDVPVGTGHTVTATPPTGSTVTGPRTFTVPPDSEEPITGLDFVVTPPPPTPTGSLAGTVTRQGDGGLGGVPVLITGLGGASYSTVTAPDGSWSASGLEPGDYTATVQPPAGTTVVGDDSLDPTIPAQGGDVGELDFVLAVTPVSNEPRSAGGTVTTPDGDPVPGVVIEVIDPADGSTSRDTTDSDGAWSVDDLPAGQGYTARVVDVPDGFQPPDDPTLGFDVDDADVTGLDFELVPIETSPSPTPTPTLTPTPTPTPSSTTAAPTPTVTVTTDSDDSDDDSDSSSSSGLASTGGPSLLIGVGGALLVLAGVLSVAYGVRRRRRG